MVKSFWVNGNEKNREVKLFLITGFNSPPRLLKSLKLTVTAAGCRADMS